MLSRTLNTVTESYAVLNIFAHGRTILSCAVNETGLKPVLSAFYSVRPRSFLATAETEIKICNLGKCGLLLTMMGDNWQSDLLKVRSIKTLNIQLVSKIGKCINFLDKKFMSLRQ